jgi:hypothetical protein
MLRRKEYTSPRRCSRKATFVPHRRKTFDNEYKAFNQNVEIKYNKKFMKAIVCSFSMGIIIFVKRSSRATARTLLICKWCPMMKFATISEIISCRYETYRETSNIMLCYYLLSSDFFKSSNAYYIFTSYCYPPLIVSFDVLLGPCHFSWLTVLRQYYELEVVVRGNKI